MQLILLSGGSGKRLWPLSNDAYSKQVLRLLPGPNGNRESMLQRVVRQVNEARLGAEITIATVENQCDAISSQLGNTVGVVTEPERRDTFPAIALACLYLEKELSCPANEVVVVMPSDPYTDEEYFQTVKEMANAVQNEVADLVLMGITPTCPSTKYGYIVPSSNGMGVQRFTEKPDAEKAKELIDAGALWNGGVFAFRLGYMVNITRKYMQADTFAEARSRYGEFPKISFDYEVAEKAQSIAVVPFKGMWKDLGTWDALTEVLDTTAIGNVVLDEQCHDTYVINQLDVPCVCVGTDNLVVAASPNGFLVAGKESSERIKPYVAGLDARPMYEERRWGTYKVVDNYQAKYETGGSLTKHLCLYPGKSINYQKHNNRAEVWAFIEGKGRLVLDGEIKKVQSGDVVYIPKGMKHALMAITELHFIEVQLGDKLVEEDMERFEWIWE